MDEINEKVARLTRSVKFDLDEFTATPKWRWLYRRRLLKAVELGHQELETAIREQEAQFERLYGEKL